MPETKNKSMALAKEDSNPKTFSRGKKRNKMLKTKIITK